MTDKPQTTEEKVVGHKTFHSPERGYWHEPLYENEAEAIMASARAAEEKRAADMPDEKAAINAMWSAYQRLRELGWSEAIYCPKDGSSFNAIEAGSTGIFRCHYQGEWPEGSWWAEDGGDLWPSRPVLYKLDPEKEAERKARMAEAAKKFKEEMDAES